MSVYYKFKSALSFDTVIFDGVHISLQDLKKAIVKKVHSGKKPLFDLQITNAQTKEEYTDDKHLIPKNTSVLVVRIPLSVPQKKNQNRNVIAAPKQSKDVGILNPINKGFNLSQFKGSEEEKLKMMMYQSTCDYDPKNYFKYKGANQTGDVPPSYRCNKCHRPGHWIKNCLIESSAKIIRTKKSSGIPRSFLIPVEGPSVPGAMMTPDGFYAITHMNREAYQKVKKEKQPLTEDKPVEQKPQIPEGEICNMCENLIVDAIMVPCCGHSFCDLCIRSHLLESEDQECPACKKKNISPAELIPNRFLRNAVAKYKKESNNVKQPGVKQVHLSDPKKTGSPPSKQFSIKTESSATTKEKQLTIAPETSSEKNTVDEKPKAILSLVNPTSTEQCTSSYLERPNKRCLQPSTVDEPHLIKQAALSSLPLEQYEAPSQHYSQPPPNNWPVNYASWNPDAYVYHENYYHQQSFQYGPTNYNDQHYYQQQYEYTQPILNYSVPPTSASSYNYDYYHQDYPSPPSGSVLSSKVTDDPMEVFEQMLKERDDRKRRLGNHHRRNRNRSTSRSPSRSSSFNRSSPTYLSRDDDRHRGIGDKSRSQKHEKLTREYDDKDRDYYDQYSGDRKRARRSVSPFERKSRSESYDSSREANKKNNKDREDKKKKIGSDVNKEKRMETWKEAKENKDLNNVHLKLTSTSTKKHVLSLKLTI